MKSWLFFGNPGDCEDIVDLLLLRRAIAEAHASLLETELRDCALEHIKWMESEIRKQSAL